MSNYPEIGAFRTKTVLSLIDKARMPEAQKSRKRVLPNMLELEPRFKVLKLRRPEEDLFSVLQEDCKVWVFFHVLISRIHPIFSEAQLSRKRDFLHFLDLEFHFSI